MARLPAQPWHFEFTPLDLEDLPMLREWLLRPHVAARWGEAESVDELEKLYLPQLPQTTTTRACIAWCNDERVGFIQCYVVMGSGDGWWEGETDPGARGIDQFLCDADQLDRGLGAAMIGAFVDDLFADPQVTVVQTDPAPDNLRAIACYRRVGLEAVGPVQTPDGDALLMRMSRGRT